MRKAVKNAVTYFDAKCPLDRRSVQYKGCIEKIKQAERPLSVAKNLLRKYRNLPQIKTTLNDNQAIDHSDVEELRVKLIRKQGGILPEQANLFVELDRKIARDKCTRNDIEYSYKIVLQIKPTSSIRKMWKMDKLL